MARRWESIAREATRTAVFLASLGLIVYFGMSIAIEVETTQIRLFLAGAVFGAALGAGTLLDHLWRDQVPTDTTSRTVN